MSITTYAELQTAVGVWLDDTSLSSYVPDFIALGQSRINRDLDKIRTSWTDASLTGTTSSRAIALPSSFVEAGALWLVDTTENILLHPFVMGSRDLSTSNGKPVAWCINGAYVNFDCPLDSAYSFVLRHRAKWDLATDLTNWLLTNHPDIYLSASLVEAYAFRGNEEQAVKWEIRYKNAVDEVNRKEARSEKSKLLVDDSLVPASRWFNYDTGE